MTKNTDKKGLKEKVFASLKDLLLASGVGIIAAGILYLTLGREALANIGAKVAPMHVAATVLSSFEEYKCINEEYKDEALTVTATVGVSMRPTLSGEFNFVKEFTLTEDTVIKRGDIVATKLIGEHQGLSKRVVGVPGDTIEMKDGNLYVNGELVNYGNLDSAYAKYNYYTLFPEEISAALKTLIPLCRENQVLWDGYPLEELLASSPNYKISEENRLGERVINNICFTLKEDDYFLVGDNLPHSTDSRCIGPFHRDELEGIFVMIGVSEEPNFAERLLSKFMED